MRITLSHVGFLCQLDLGKLCSLGHHVLVLNSHNSTSPGSSEVVVVVELNSEALGEDI